MLLFHLNLFIYFKELLAFSSNQWHYIDIKIRLEQLEKVCCVLNVQEYNSQAKWTSVNGEDLRDACCCCFCLSNDCIISSAVNHRIVYLCIIRTPGHLVTRGQTWDRWHGGGAVGGLSAWQGPGLLPFSGGVSWRTGQRVSPSDVWLKWVHFKQIDKYPLLISKSVDFHDSSHTWIIWFSLCLGYG